MTAEEHRRQAEQRAQRWDTIMFFALLALMIAGGIARLLTKPQ